MSHASSGRETVAETPSGVPAESSESGTDTAIGAGWQTPLGQGLDRRPGSPELR
eukprot:CAMPEP_0171198720 /NCGR_PEP_ID=MMETSP0790-20130122/23090_1 /TAXON_ID=2925 /ORGANISM="Alexandrium catenella, Strain OF101" /LENGTH=53 /DNA_ID=CAMNT_0011664037 /DNA_START=63 /DNA_END=220 /DNA_ORIENTATION=-